MQRLKQYPRLLPRRIPVIAARRSSSTAAPSLFSVFSLSSLVSIAVGVALSAAYHEYVSPPKLLADHVKSPRDRPYATDFKDAIAELHAQFPADQVSINEDDLIAHGVSPNSHHPPANPAVILYPNSTEDVQKAVRIAYKYRMPLTPFSGGTSLESHCSAPHGGMCLDLSRMDQILEIHEQDGDLVCQSGARWMDINETLQEQGIPLFFPLDPGPGYVYARRIFGCSSMPRPVQP